MLFIDQWFKSIPKQSEKLGTSVETVESPAATLPRRFDGCAALACETVESTGAAARRQNKPNTQNETTVGQSRVTKLSNWPERGRAAKQTQFST